jgi:hypothetical protein
VKENGGSPCGTKSTRPAGTCSVEEHDSCEDAVLEEVRDASAAVEDGFELERVRHGKALIPVAALPSSPSTRLRSKHHGRILAA